MAKNFDQVEKTLRELAPGGHDKFIPYALYEIMLHAAKNRDYTKGGDPLGNFNRVAKILSMYPGLDMGQPYNVALVYMLKQLDAVMWMFSQKYEGEVEGVAERIQDISVYSKLMRILFEESKGKRK